MTVEAITDFWLWEKMHLLVLRFCLPWRQGLADGLSRRFWWGWELYRRISLARKNWNNPRGNQVKPFFSTSTES